MRKTNLSALILAPLFALSCSKGGGGNNTVPTGQVDLLETEMNGTYVAFLAPVNPAVSGHLNGSLTTVRSKDTFIADVRLSGGPASVLHAQSIHVGSRCPDQSDDLNGDGYVDAEEGASVYKEILIPLDDDLTSQWMGFGTFPVSDEFGYYFWSRTVSFEKLMKDLRDEDINPADDFAKLNANKSFNVKERVVVITGVPETTNLPDTVSGRGRGSKHQALPIACGVIRKLEKVPGTIDTDHTGIPLPDGEAVGGSSGADDGADFSQATTNGTSGGNYGEEEEVETVDNSTEFGNGHPIFPVVTSDGREITN